MFDWNVYDGAIHGLYLHTTWPISLRTLLYTKLGAPAQDQECDED